MRRGKIRSRNLYALTPSFIEKLRDMPVRDHSPGAAFRAAKPPADHGVNTDTGDLSYPLRSAELLDDGSGWLMTHSGIFDNRTDKVKPACSISAQDAELGIVRNAHMRRDPYIEWLIENLKRPGKSQSGLARHLGLQPSMINKVVNGSRKLASHELAGAAAYFGEEAPAVSAATQSGGLKPAVVVGTAEAGAFREVDEMMDDGERVEVAVPADDKFPNARLIIFDVAGDSMNALTPRPVLDGDRVVCVAYEDVAHSFPLRDGMVVVVERKQAGGHIREWSVKQLEIYEDRLEFHPRSHNGRHKPIVVQRDLEADDGVSVEIIGMVRRVINEIPIS